MGANKKGTVNFINLNRFCLGLDKYMRGEAGLQNQPANWSNHRTYDVSESTESFHFEKASVKKVLSYKVPDTYSKCFVLKAKDHRDPSAPTTGQMFPSHSLYLRFPERNTDKEPC